MTKHNLLSYTNGVGHFAMSIFMTLVGLTLIVVPGLNSGAQGVGIGLILAVQAAWFVPGAAKQVAYEVSKQLVVIPPVEADQNKVLTQKLPKVPPTVQP